MGQAAQRKKKLKLLDVLGLDKISDMEAALVQKFGAEKAKEILSDWERISKETEHSDLPGMQNALYEYLNREYDLGMMVARYTDAAILRDFAVWIYDHRSSFGRRILDVGCGNGILSCLLASYLPDAQILAIDRSENCIRIAEQVRERLQLSNIEFRNTSVQELKNEKYDTVLSVRTFHENIGLRKTEIRFMSFSEQIRTYESIYRNYLEDLAGLAVPGGNLICIERNQFDTEWFSIWKVLQELNFTILPEGLKELSCQESDFKEPSVFQTLIAKKAESEPVLPSSEDLFRIFQDRAFSKSDDPDFFTRPQTDWFIETNAGNLIEGYVSYDGEDTQLAKASLYEKKDDPGFFLMCQANYGRAGVQVLPLEALDEAKEIFEEHKTIDRTRGFLVRPV